MAKSVKTFIVVKIVTCFVEAKSLKKAKEIADRNKEIEVYTSKKVIKETDDKNCFWNNLDVDKIENLKIKADANRI